MGKNKMTTIETLGKVNELLADLEPADESTSVEIEELKLEVRGLISIAHQGFERTAESSLEILSPRIDELIRRVVV